MMISFGPLKNLSTFPDATNAFISFICVFPALNYFKITGQKFIMQALTRSFVGHLGDIA
eukprot:m.125778 g.125778  ORF g.125778 m.125778 type:complete len:59 (+) comp14500_c0_seq2:1038-1214(+)